MIMCVSFSVSVCDDTKYVDTQWGSSVPVFAFHRFSSPPSSKSISHFVSAWISPSLFQKCSLNTSYSSFFSFSISHLSISALPLPLRSFSHLKPYQISPPTIPYYSYYLYYSHLKGLSNQPSVMTPTYLYKPVHPKHKLAQSYCKSQSVP